MTDRTVLSGIQVIFRLHAVCTCHSLSICTLMFCPLIVHVYSCFPENEAPAVFLYSVMLVGSGDCKQVNGPDPPLHCIGVLSGPLHCVYTQLVITVYRRREEEHAMDSGVVLTTHQCSAVEGLVHSPAYSHQTLLTSHCTRILQELHSQGNSCTHVLSVDRTSVCRLRVSDRYKPHAV